MSRRHEAQTSVTLPDPDGTQGSATSPVWSYEYNDFMQLETVTNPMSHDTDYGYDTAGRLTSVTDTLSNVTTYTYDLMNRITEVESPDPDGTGGPLTSSVTEYTYDSYSRLTEIEDANSGVITKTYDAAGQLLSLDDQSGNTTYWAYDQLGRQIMETDELGYTRSFDYNEIDRLIRKHDREGRTTLYGYDGYKELEWWYDPGSTVAEASVTTTTQGGGGNDEVQTVTLTDLSDGTFRLAFGGQVSAPIAHDADAATVETALEALESVDNVSVTLAASVYTITFVGDHANTDVSPLQADVTPDSPGTKIREIEFEYDEAFRLVATDDNKTGSFDYVVDNLGRTTQTTERYDGFLGSIVLDFDYDDASNRTEMAVTSGAYTDYKNTYEYDDLNRLWKVTQDDDGGNAVAEKQVRFLYNSLNQFTYINRFENTTGSDPALRTYFTYDSGDRTDTIQHRDVASGGTTTLLNQYSFTYDKMNRITEIDSTLDGVSDYTYDAEGQLTDADHATGRTDEAYTYDSTGNRTGGDYVVGDKNQTTESTGYEYEYDREGNRTKRTDTGDDSYEVYIYDHRNRLTDVEFYDSGDNLQSTLEYKYDVFNRMIYRAWDADGSGGNAAVETFWGAFDGISATLEFDDDSTDDISHRFLWGPHVDMCKRFVNYRFLSSRLVWAMCQWWSGLA